MNYKILVNSIRQTHNFLQTNAVKAVNKHLTLRNWLIGYYIIEYEQKGKDRAKYGLKLLERLAGTLEEKKVKGLTAPELSRLRQFYKCYPKMFGTLSQKLLVQNNVPLILGTVSQTSKTGKAPADYNHQLFHHISFSHFVELIKIEEEDKRKYYELLVIKTGLSVRELKRQAATLSYERMGLSSKKDLALKKLEDKIHPKQAGDAVKDIYLFEFLNLPNVHLVEEEQLETALLDHLQHFIIELGNGFCFEARQKRMLIGDEYFFVDLVFYHRILKCHVLIDLKVDTFNHTHASQLTTYLNYYKKEIARPNDNPPIGILMVTDKNKALVEYATANEKDRLFISKYKLQLPSKKQLKAFVENELKKL
ncbi:MAG: DUF1016 family protein [Bacteroidia bacterium]|nr:DUF1016 family protein [Bacteroidia bacterium]